ncbi:hypothetical protein TBLA_0C00630 [Henningerozyma blattae CBS 6284]|uniref:Uncharacterized protein n=1 Tax=Henningerozyma blattae (strain ATCC 34711 / CBS 6284 / DSM 70876 / NBRC 10599 / NRRL Y-10934 / UCD 77-7) TaxID=1071380 RepID=I2H0H7_HENB6|nr:hypothetical protein TBLA_0C00630 [Tetrapisispora blattae CBS 6284]CCH59879.1 hypothetical protein TBLA_0C00630 [Tetrapisispora blattae CBS 6284]
MDSEQVAPLQEFEEKLSKIRSQINSKLENQKHAAIILAAIEENIADQTSNQTSKSIINYTVSLLSLLDQAMNQETDSIKDLQLATSTAYLLDLVFAHTPKKLLRSKFAEILGKIAPFITNESASAPLIRSSIGCLESLLISENAQAWNNTHGLSITPTRGLQGLLELTLDPRPKVRKRAQEAVSTILKNPPAAPTAEHVASGFIADFVITQLSAVLHEAKNISNKKLRAQNGGEEINRKFIHNLQLASSIISTNQWPSNKIEVLCDLLLEVTKSSDQFLISSAFTCFETLFTSMATATSQSGLADDKYARMLDIIFSLKPSTNDSHLSGSWIAVVVKGMAAYSTADSMKALLKLPDVFNLMSNYLASQTPEISYSASQCLIALINQAIQDELLLVEPAQDKNVVKAVDTTLSIISTIITEFLTVKYTHCAKEILRILAAAFIKFSLRSDPHFIKPLKIVDSWRVNENAFIDLKNESEVVIGSAIQALGPEVVLTHLPLNLENPTDGQPGRAWLLPIIRDYTRNTTLQTFISKLAPLIQVFESKLAKLPKESVQRKVFETVIDQIWSTLPHFCELPLDLRASFNDDFASELCSLMYSKVELRNTLCHSLKVLVESNQLYANGALSNDILLQQHFPISESKLNLEYLATKSSNLLAVLFNVYTQTSPNARGYILETIESYLKITSSEDLEKTFNNVCALLKNALDEEVESQKGKPQLTPTLLDLIVCMTKYVPSTSYSALFSIFGRTVNSRVGLTQKRAYRIITKLSELESGSEAVASFVSDIEKIIVDNTNTVQTPAKASRLASIKTLVELLPNDHLDFIVKVVPEVILCTKDVNEKSRDAAFETLIAMGNKMNSPNSIIKLSNIDGYDSQAPNQPASIAEFFKIMSAGLIGESQHMVSSTITAYACLVFEFKDQLSADLLLEIYDTVELYLTSNSREIAKSAIGFTKVCVLGLPPDIMREKIPSLLPKLLRWSNEHTGHFKSKIKNIIERLVRKFGYEFIEANFPAEDYKLLANIRKTRNRNKRKETEEEANNDARIPVLSNNKASKFFSAFDEAVYDSSGDEQDLDDEKPNKRSKKPANQYIMESGENPLDLLDSETLAHISSTRPKKFNKNNNKKLLKNDAFSFDDEGKLIIKGVEKPKSADEDPLKSVTNGINAYLEVVEHGPIRGQRNKLKFRKGSDEGDSDDEISSKLLSKKVDTKNKIGKNFKKGNKFRPRRKL